MTVCSETEIGSDYWCGDRICGDFCGEILNIWEICFGFFSDSSLFFSDSPIFDSSHLAHIIPAHREKYL